MHHGERREWQTTPCPPPAPFLKPTPREGVSDHRTWAEGSHVVTPNFKEQGSEILPCAHKENQK